MLKRPVNVGFSGGEKKRNEMVQMGIIDPEVRDPRRDRQRAGHRRAAHRRRRHQPHHARARQGSAAHHPLPAAARLREAGFRPCAGRRPHHALGRGGAGARARGEGYGAVAGMILRRASDAAGGAGDGRGGDRDRTARRRWRGALEGGACGHEALDRRLRRSTASAASRWRLLAAVRIAPTAAATTAPSPRARRR